MPVERGRRTPADKNIRQPQLRKITIIMCQRNKPQVRSAVIVIIVVQNSLPPIESCASLLDPISERIPWFPFTPPSTANHLSPDFHTFLNPPLHRFSLEFVRACVAAGVGVVVVAVRLRGYEREES